ncbi:MAG: tetratricopeptide repeat protein [Xanthobacteraceae bacterium]
MADIFREVDEEVRREQLKRLWDRYGLFIVAAAVLVVVGVGAWRAYQWYEARKAAEAGAAYNAAAQLAQDGKPTEATAAFAQLATSGTPAYRTLARLREAEVMATRDSAAAVAMFDEVAANSGIPQLLRDLATVRAGFVLVDKAPYADITRRLEPLAQPNGSFRHSARELLALSAWRSGDMAAARRWAEAALADPDAPAGLRARIDVLMALTSENGKSS